MEVILAKILVVDDELNILKAIKRILRNVECEVKISKDPEKAISLLERSSYDVILSDYRMPKMDGISVLKHAKKLYPHSVRMLMSGKADFDTLSKAINEVEIYRFIYKPFDNYEVLSSINHAIGHKLLQDENIRLASIIRDQESKLSLQQKELNQLEQIEPGITKVKRGHDGRIIVL